MKSALLPLGSVVRFRTATALVAGYTFQEQNGTLVPAYLVVGYPEGYTGAKSLKILRTDLAEEVSRGWESEVSNTVLRYMGQMSELAQRMSADEMRILLKKGISE